MSNHSKKWDRKERGGGAETETKECSCHHTHPDLEKEFQYRHLKKRLAEEKERMARKIKEPNDRYQTSLDNFFVEK